jgi:hypothetical protein
MDEEFNGEPVEEDSEMNWNCDVYVESNIAHLESGRIRYILLGRNSATRLSTKLR